MYTTVLFDLDGTIIDSEKGITNSAAYALAKFGIHAEPSTLRNFIGPPLLNSFHDFYGFSNEKAAQAVDFYREYYGTTGVYECTVYDGMEELFIKLKKEGKKIILATSKYEFYAAKVLEKFKLIKYFDFIAGSLKNGGRGSKSEIISYILETQNITDKSSVVMVGDKKHDIIGAVETVVDSIGVLYGFGNYEELNDNGATHIAKDANEILKIIMEQRKSLA